MADEAPPPDVAASVDPGPYRRAAWKVRIAVTFFALALVLVTGEGLARLSVKRELPVWAEHPLCWRVLSPNQSVRRGTGDKAFDFETNAFGFRGKSVAALKKPADVYRIVFLGDDATLASDTAENGTFVAEVERALNARRGEKDPKVEALNAAGPGFFAPVHHATLVHRILPLEPDLVVLMSAVEEVKAALASDFDETGARFTAKVEPLRFTEWLCSASDLAYAIRRQARKSGHAETPRDPAPTERLAARDSAADPKRGLPVFKRHLSLIAAACREAKADLVLMTQPTLYKEKLTPEEANRLPRGQDEALRAGVDVYNEELRAHAPRCGARLVDMASLMTRDLEHLKDDVHFTPHGHGIVAGRFVEEVFRDKPATRRK